MTGTNNDIDVLTLAQKLSEVFEFNPETKKLIADKHKLDITDISAAPVNSPSRSTFRDLLNDYKKVIENVKKYNFLLTTDINFDYAFQEILLHFEKQHGLYKLLTENKPSKFLSSDWELDPTWSEHDHYTCYNSCDIMLKAWLKESVIGNLADNMIRPEHYQRLSPYAIIEMVKEIQPLETKLATAITELMQEEYVASCNTLRTRINAYASQRKRFVSMMSCFPNPWDVQNTLRAIFPSIIQLGIEKEFIPMIREKIVKREDIVPQDFLDVITEKGLDTFCDIDPIKVFPVHAAFVMRKKDEKRDMTDGPLTFGLSKDHPRIANLKKRDSLLAQAATPKMMKPPYVNPFDGNTNPVANSDVVKCSDCWDIWHHVKYHPLPVAVRRSTPMRQFKEFKAYESEFITQWVNLAQNVTGKPMQKGRKPTRTRNRSSRRGNPNAPRTRSQTSNVQDLEDVNDIEMGE
ncbi:hypothetical protein DAKH74_038540 [Maudiozyma humilis]|uniref:Uncharacterized protein n=1 Tax=Maudiozyma humilis TaxID=51915 RepID=A0AAV5S2X2_MAUHU|nr:hypothetical protein DAKH74_038540 [Kazachstania humilis]